MKKVYDHKQLESQWQSIWDQIGLFQNSYFTNEQNADVTSDNKLYILPQLPYPSGFGLHMGHCATYIPCDIYARHQRMKGKKVLQVMGWDAFGLPAENFAIKTNVHPRINTDKAITTFREQIKSLGISVDWSREVGSHTPDYYKFTQWFFLLMYKMGLAYRKKQEVNWCDGCKTVLANEQVVDGKCERCETEVIQKQMEQWFFKITDYADRLHDDLDKVDWPEESVKRQRDWIGRKKGINITYQVDGLNETVTCFTTRPDTNFGATFVVISPEHDLAQKIIDGVINVTGAQIKPSLTDYAKKARKKTELERISEGKIKTGVFTGLYAINNLNNKKLPIWVSDFVISSFGTGAVVGVPAHDSRDFDFAKTFGIEVIPVVKRVGLQNYRSYLMGASNISDTALTSLKIKIEKTADGDRKLEIPVESIPAYKQIIKDKLDKGFWNEIVGEDIWFYFKSKDGNNDKEYVLNLDNWNEIATLCSEYCGADIKITQNLWVFLANNDWYRGLMVQEDDGVMINSDFLNGLDIHTATEKVMDYLVQKGWGKRITTFKLRDWSISRQRFWGAPIPMVYDPEGNIHPVSLDDLPVILPDDVDFHPNGKSPLTDHVGFQKGVEEKYGKGWRREVETLDTFMDSSWYYFRYLDPKNDKEFASKEVLDRWMPVDFYIGGPEHVTGHLLYSRFFTKVLYDAGYIKYDEPFKFHRHQGLIMGEDGKKMSKRLGNVINPTQIVSDFGADTARMYVMFMGPLEVAKPWDTNGVKGVKRFLTRVYNLVINETKAQSDKPSAQKLYELLNLTIYKVDQDITNLKYNTAVAKLMEFINLWEKPDQYLAKSDTIKFVKILAPFAPYLAEELFYFLNNKVLVSQSLDVVNDYGNSVHVQSWPEYDLSTIKNTKVNVVVQVNGKVRAIIKDLDANQSKDTVVESAKQQVSKYLDNQIIKKTVYVQDKLINFVI